MDYDSLVDTIGQLAEYRRTAALDSPAHARLVEHERELRARLAKTREHQDAQARWRRRVQANKSRRSQQLTATPLECA